MNDYGKVSIITPAYNCEDFIEETIESIQSQTYTNWELLITDDCSTDKTRRIIQRLARQDSRIKLRKLPKNGGPAAARNHSIKHARGRFIAFCDSDDLWFPDKLETQLDFMMKTDCCLSYTSYYTCDEFGAVNGFVECLKFMDKFRILRDNGVGCLTAVYDTEKTGKIFMPLIRKRQDWALWIDIILKNGKALGLQKPLAMYRMRDDSVSANKVKMLKYNYAVYHEILGFSAIKSSMYLGMVFLPYYFYKKIKQRTDYMSSRPFPFPSSDSRYADNLLSRSRLEPVHARTSRMDYIPKKK